MVYKLWVVENSNSIAVVVYSVYCVPHIGRSPVRRLLVPIYYYNSACCSLVFQYYIRL